MVSNLYSIKLYPASEEYWYPRQLIYEGWLFRNRKRMQDKEYKLIKVAENRRSKEALYQRLQHGII